MNTFIKSKNPTRIGLFIFSVLFLVPFFSNGSNQDQEKNFRLDVKDINKANKAFKDSIYYNSTSQIRLEKERLEIYHQKLLKELELAQKAGPTKTIVEKNNSSLEYTQANHDTYLTRKVQVRDISEIESDLSSVELLLKDTNLLKKSTMDQLEYKKRFKENNFVSFDIGKIRKGLSYVIAQTEPDSLAQMFHQNFWLTGDYDSTFSIAGLTEDDLNKEFRRLTKRQQSSGTSIKEALTSGTNRSKALVKQALLNVLLQESGFENEISFPRDSGKLHLANLLLLSNALLFNTVDFTSNARMKDFVNRVVSYSAQFFEAPEAAFTMSSGSDSFMPTGNVKIFSNAKGFLTWIKSYEEVINSSSSTQRKFYLKMSSQSSNRIFCKAVFQ